MSTVREMFREAMATQDWGVMCSVYEAITGEAAPDVIVAKVDVLDQEMAMTTRPENPLDRDMDDDRSMTKKDYEDIFETPYPSDEDDLFVDDDDDYERGVTQAQAIVTGTNIPDILPATPSIVALPEPVQPPTDDVASEFYIQHGNTQGATNDDGETQCRKESMSIPQQRKNRFRDNGRAFADEKVTTHPDDPKLGIQSIRPRGLVRDAEMGVDTGALVPVVCTLCGTQETVAIRLSTGYNADPDHNTYKCNSCNTPNGRAKVMRRQRNDMLNNNAPRRGTDTQRR